MSDNFGRDGLTGLDETIRRKGNAEQLADEILERIVTGQIPPGTPLREAAIAEAGGVARNTAREVLRILMASGLVQHYPHRGVAVCELSGEDVRDIYNLRVMAELEGVKAADPMQSHHAARLEQAMQDFEAAATANDVGCLVAADLAFHSRIVELASSPRLDRFYRTLANEVRFGFSVLSVLDREFENPQPLVAEHRTILTHLLRGESDTCSRLLVEHLRRFGDRMFDVISERQDDTGLGPDVRRA
jgi:DNA-binding GntR family transcriptional regulator